MWLQMMWLMAAPKKDIRQCRWCHKIITFEGPRPPKGDAELKNDRSHGYRTRKDKKFCNDRCRASHHYYRHAKYR